MTSRKSPRKSSRKPPAPGAAMTSAGRVRITYRSAPAESTRAALGRAGFHWSTRDRSWYAAPTEAAVALARKVNPKFRGRASV